MDGTGELLRPFADALPSRLDPTIVSYPPDRPLGYAELHPFVDAAVPASGPYVLVAESFSGPLAILHAAARPGRLRALVLSATFASNPLSPSLRGLGILSRPSLFASPPPEPFARAFLAGPNASPALLDLVRSVSRKVDPAVMAFRLRQVLEVDVEASLPSIAVPVLYLAGSADRLVGKRARNRIAARLPSMRTVVLDAPHLLLQVCPEEAAREIGRFLSGDGALLREAHQRRDGIAPP